jgi:delta24-sterol reductase
MSYGTLGFVTNITLQIIEYKPFIRLTYRPCYTLTDTVELLSKETHKETENDSVEGIAYSKDTAVIMTGQFVTEDKVEKQKINRHGLWYKPWFYQYVQTFLEKGKGEYVEYVPTLHFHQQHQQHQFQHIKHNQFQQQQQHQFQHIKHNQQQQQFAPQQQQ